jgi:hypothetical protein
MAKPKLTYQEVIERVAMRGVTHLEKIQRIRDDNGGTPEDLLELAKALKELGNLIEKEVATL